MKKHDNVSFEMRKQSYTIQFHVFLPKHILYAVLAIFLSLQKKEKVEQQWNKSSFIKNQQ